MGTVNKPNDFSANTTISSSEVNDNFDTIYDEFNGNIAAANLATDAVTTAKIADSNVTTAKIADSNVTTAKLANSSVTNAKLDTTAGAPGGAWTSWTPTWANLTIGNATVNCKYMQIGKTVKFRVDVTLGNTSSVSTAPTFTLPVTSVTSPSAFMVIGWGAYVQGSGAKDAMCRWTTTTTSTLSWWDVNNDLGNVTSTTPFTWASGDRIYLQGFYEAA